jgi:hypothetical protein
MSRLSKNKEFHIPFIKELVFVGLVTIVSMISVHIFLTNFLPESLKPYTLPPAQSYSEMKP